MTIDTNIIIAYLDDETVIVEALTRQREYGGLLYLPTIVETEILSFSKWKSMAEQRDVESFLETNFVSVPLDRVLCRIAAEIRRNTKIKSPDAIVAATAIYTNTPLVTRNTRDFKNVRGLNILTL